MEDFAKNFNKFYSIPKKTHTELEENKPYRILEAEIKTFKNKNSHENTEAVLLTLKDVSKNEQNFNLFIGGKYIPVFTDHVRMAINSGEANINLIYKGVKVDGLYKIPQFLVNLDN